MVACHEVDKGAALTSSYHALSSLELQPLCEVCQPLLKSGPVASSTANVYKVSFKPANRCAPVLVVELSASLAIPACNSASAPTELPNIGIIDNERVERSLL
jgi:hypothetical protein